MVALTLAKVVIGLLAGSVVLLSDAVHSASDLVSVVASWFGLKIAGKRADERFPYGYYKAENLATVVVSFLILFAFWHIFSEGVAALKTLSSIKIPFFALGIALIDALVLFFFGRYEIKVGKEINSQALIAMGKENRAHLFSSLAVFGGILSVYFQIPYIEGLVTIGISLLILEIGLSAAKDSIFALMDVSPGKKIEKGVVRLIESVAGAEEAFDLRLRRAGPFLFGEVKVGIRRKVDVARAHWIADQAEKKVKKKFPQIDSLAVSVEPFVSSYVHLAIPVKKKGKLDVAVSEKFGRAPFLLFVNLYKNKIKGYYFIKNPYQSQKLRVGLALAKLVAKQKTGVLITKQIGEIAFYTLGDNLIDVYRLKGKTAQQVVDNFVKGKLALLITPGAPKV